MNWEQKILQSHFSSKPAQGTCYRFFFHYFGGLRNSKYHHEKCMRSFMTNCEFGTNHEYTRATIWQCTTSFMNEEHGFN